jgi:hypothetical protein
MDEQAGGGEPATYNEQIEIIGSQLLDLMGYLLRDGKVRQIRIKAPGGQLLFDAPKDGGLWGDGVMGLGPPWPGILGAVSAMVPRMTIEVTRTDAPAKEETVRTRENGNGGSRPN